MSKHVPASRIDIAGFGRHLEAVVALEELA
jgi:hypothetical protein